MPDVDASIVFLPRFTTLVGNANPSAVFEFTTLPLDVSKHSGAQFQIWRGPMSGGTFKFFLEESLDGEKWVLGASTPEGIELNADDAKFCSYAFRLRWFRIRIQLTGAAWPIVTCWAEGLLRGGGGGVWPAPMQPTSSTTDALTAAGAIAPSQVGASHLAFDAENALAGLLGKGGGGFNTVQALQQAIAKAQGGKP